VASERHNGEFLHYRDLDIPEPYNPGMTATSGLRVGATTDAAGPTPGDRRLSTDGEGRLYDAALREMLSRTSRMDEDLLCGVETLNAVASAGKVLKDRFDEHLAQFGITHQQFRAMMWLRGCPGCGSQLHHVAGWLGVTPRTVTGMIDALEAAGLVERVADPADRRAVIARLTTAGKDRVNSARRVHHRYVRHLVKRLGEGEAATLRHLSLKLIEAVEESFPGKSPATLWK
jgi:DNA-binding MarR family transcriptional regulator